jgi:hypothetical protein
MATKRTRVKSRGGSRFVRRGAKGQFDEVESVGRSLKQDRKRAAKKPAKSGEGDRGDRKVKSPAKSRAKPRSKSRR